MNKSPQKQIAIFYDIVNNNHKNAGIVTDFMLKDLDNFFSTSNQLKIPPKAILKFISKDASLYEKVDSFIDKLNEKEFEEHKANLDFILSNHETPAYKEKQKRLDALVHDEEVLDFLKEIDISFLGTNDYADYSHQLKALNKFDIKDIPSDVAISFIKTIFQAEGGLSWTVDGSSRMLSARLLEPIYKSPQVIALTQREFKKHPQLLKSVGSEVADAINLITEWSLRPINENGGSSINAAQNKKLLSLCAEILQVHQIPVVENSIFQALDYEDSCERDSMEYAYRKPKKLKFEKIQENLDEFKSNIEFTVKIKKNKP